MLPLVDLPSVLRFTDEPRVCRVRTEDAIETDRPRALSVLDRGRSGCLVAAEVVAAGVEAEEFNAVEVEAAEELFFSTPFCGTTRLTHTVVNVVSVVRSRLASVVVRLRLSLACEAGFSFFPFDFLTPCLGRLLVVAAAVVIVSDDSSLMSPAELLAPADSASVSAGQFDVTSAPVTRMKPIMPRTATTPITAILFRVDHVLVFSSVPSMTGVPDVVVVAVKASLLSSESSSSDTYELDISTLR